jgi:hypothetical protein
MNSDDRHAAHAQRNKGIRARFPAPIRARFMLAASAQCFVIALAACIFVGAAAASAQTEVMRCLPPGAPMTELPVEVLAEYRTEIAAEFEAYFASVTAHIACLDEERARAMDEARIATEAYTRLITTIPARKDLP